MAATDECKGCGLRIPGGTSACQALMDELTTLHFSDVTYFAVHRLFVDIYCLQHPDRYCASFKSLASHLMHLCWSLEHGGSRAVASDVIEKWVDRNAHLQMPELPARRGVTTVGDVATAANAVAHRMAVDSWARSTWDAYRPLQREARDWVSRAIADSRE